MSFYHKYRPQKFSELYGQEHVKKTLTNALRQGKIGHAYLFSGPRGIGKTTVARLLAKALNCEQTKILNSPEPCNQCFSCQEIAVDKSLDVIEIDAASNRGIDEIRELREKIKFAPSKSRYKIFIIDEVHMLTKEAFNALLKTLEEPPKHAVFIMATTEPHKIPATILSRVQSFNFKRASIDGISDYLKKITEKEKIDIEPGALRLIAVSGDGSYRDAASLLDQVTSLGFDKISINDVQEILGYAKEEMIIKFLDSIFSKNIKAVMEIISRLFYNGYDLRQFNKSIIVYLRKMLIEKSNPDLLEREGLNREQINVLKQMSERVTVKQIYHLISLFIEAEQNLKNSGLPQLPLEIAVAEAIEKIGLIELPDNQKKNEFIVKESAYKQPRPKNPEQKVKNSVEISNEVWSKILTEIAPQNRSLYLILKESAPTKLEGGKLIIAIKFDLYKEKIKKHYKLLENVVEKVFGKKYLVEIIVDSNVSPVEYISENNDNTSNQNDIIKDAMEVFEV